MTRSGETFLTPEYAWSLYIKGNSKCIKGIILSNKLTVALENEFTVFIWNDDNNGLLA